MSNPFNENNFSRDFLIPSITKIERVLSLVFMFSLLAYFSVLIDNS